MKTIRVDGRTYAAVEVDENVACKGCIFYTVGWDMNTPQCTAANIPEFQSILRCGYEDGNRNARGGLHDWGSYLSITREPATVFNIRSTGLHTTPGVQPPGTS